jgi:TolB-like protein
VSFFTELKRRNVFRVGIAYLIGSWLLAQIAELLLDTFNAPDWTMKFIFVVLLIGFPVAIFFAWAFELTPDGIKKEKDVDRSESRSQVTGQKLNNAIIGILVLALVYFAIDKFVLTPGRAQPAQPGSEPFSQQTTDQATGVGEKRALTPLQTPLQQSVAVLPFVNMSSDPEQEYFSDGITEEIINALVKIPGLSVPARTSVFGFKGHQGDVRKIGEQLGVAHVLEGSIRSQGSQVRITAQLIKIDDGFHLWSETYDRKLDNIFVVQEEIASAIATVLTGELGLGVDTVPNKTRNMEAYDIYLQGRALIRDRSPDAIELLKQATETDPDFAPGWAALALAYQYSGYYSGDRNYQDLALTTARYSLALDPENVDALTAMAAAFRDTWQWVEADRYFNRALAIDPQSSELLEDYAEFLCMVGRWEECLAVAERGHAIDPLLTPLADAYVAALTIHGRYQEALDVIEHFAGGQTYYGSTWNSSVLLASGDKDAAILTFNSANPDELSENYANALVTLLNNPQDTQALETLRNVLSVDFKTQQNIAYSDAQQVLAFSGDEEYLISSMLALFSKNNWGNVEELWQPALAPIRQHPQFVELLELVNLPPYWDQTSWPDICQRLDDGRIECQ